MNIVYVVSHGEIQQSNAVDGDSSCECVVRPCQLGKSKNADVLVLRRDVVLALVYGKGDGIASLSST